MILTEQVKNLNQRLLDIYGKYHDKPIWRVSWSEDQFEHRYGTYRDFSTEGIFLREITEWREVPKYRQWIHEKYVLERIMPVPEINANELAEKLSYEPVWVFEDNKGNYLPPKWEAIELVIDAVYKEAAKAMGAKYKMSESDKNPEGRLDEIKRIQEELFGNDTDTTDALAYKEGVVVPSNYRSN